MNNLIKDLNVASGNNYQLIFSKLPIDSDVDRTFTLNIFETVIPSVSFGENIISWQGGKHKMITEPLNFEPGTVRFSVDEKFMNWKKIFKGLCFINNNKDIAGNAIENYGIDASLLLYDNYERIVMKLKFVSLFPLTLESVALTTRQGENYLESSCSFIYDYFEIIE